MHDAQVIIVGAGFAGLTAANALVDAGVTVVVLEARDRVDGRVHAGQLAGHTIDLGGMWVSSAQPRVWALLQRHRLETYETPLAGSGSVTLDRRQQRVPGEDFDRALGVVDRLRLLQVARAVDAAAAKVEPGRPWQAPGARSLDALTVAAWIETQTGSRAVRSVFDAICKSVFCVEARELSFLFFLFYCRSGGGLEALLTSTNGGAQHHLVHGGLHRVAALEAARLGPRLHLDEAVHGISQRDGLVTVHTGRASRTCRRVVLAAPPPLSARITFDPPLSALKRSLVERQRMGSCIKAWLAYPEPFWRRDGLNGFVIDEHEAFSPVFDATPPGDGPGLVAGFFEAEHALGLSGQPVEARRALALTVLTRHLGDGARGPLDYVEHDWVADAWATGCYGATLGPGVLTTAGHTIREAHGAVHFAGTETASEWSGYVEGAIASGERVAAEVRAAIDAARSLGR